MAKVRDFLRSQFENSKDGTDEINIGGFTALVRISESIQMTSTVPTVFLEDGTNASDHIVLNPITLTINGDVSDIHVKSRPEFEILNDIEQTIGSVNQYLPSRTQSQLTRISALANDINNAVSRVDNAIDAGENLLSRTGLTGSAKENKSNQQQFIEYIQGLINSKQLFSIQMPFRQYDNMFITAFEASYDNEGDSTGFELVATQIRFVDDKVEVDVFNTRNASSGNNGAVDAKRNRGVQEPIQNLNASEEASSNAVTSAFGG